MAEEIRVGIIGCGGIANGHIGRLISIPEAKITGLMDIDPKRLQAAAQHFPEIADVPVFEDHKEMIEELDLDATVICSPHFIHTEQILDSLNAGLHVLTEKPMVCSIEEAREVREAEETAGTVLGISYQRHTQAEYQFVRDQIASGETGDVMFVGALQGQAWLYNTRGTWRQSLEKSCGGQLNDSGSHLIDIILWMTDLAVEEVTSEIHNRGTEVDIDSAVSMRFKNGAVGTLSVIGSCPVWWEDITITCSEWAFFLRQGQPLTYTTGRQGETHTVSGFTYGSESPDHNFIDAILGRKDILAPSICGLRTIEVTEAAWKSAEQEEPFQL